MTLAGHQHPLQVQGAQRLPRGAASTPQNGFWPPAARSGMKLDKD